MKARDFGRGPTVVLTRDGQESTVISKGGLDFLSLKLKESENESDA